MENAAMEAEAACQQDEEVGLMPLSWWDKLKAWLKEWARDRGSDHNVVPPRPPLYRVRWDQIRDGELVAVDDVEATLKDALEHQEPQRGECPTCGQRADGVYWKGNFIVWNKAITEGDPGSRKIG